jgi:hypothetical protein
LDERLSSETLACNEDPHPRRGFGHAHRLPVESRRRPTELGIASVDGANCCPRADSSRSAFRCAYGPPLRG